MIPPDAAPRASLGCFLRAQRARLAPRDLGLAPTARRRTPGLRREELAALAGISVTWYTRIEQGRDVTMSPAAAGRLACALQLTPVARRHLFALAGLAEPSRPDAAREALSASLLASVAVITAPAYVLDAGWTARAWNAPAAALFADWLGGPDHNLLRYVFLDPAARGFVLDWPARARRLVAECRAEAAGPAAGLAGLIRALRAGSAEFGQWWDEQQVMAREGGERGFRLRDGRVLRLHQLTLTPATDPGARLVILLDGPAADARQGEGGA